jgi:hypothetical protein
MTSIPANSARSAPVAARPAAGVAERDRTAERGRTARDPYMIPPAAAWLLAVGAMLAITGLAWDIQWHNEVGPDTFFTLPHLLIYSSAAFIGLPCLAISLRILNSQRADGRLSLAPIPTPLLIAGFATALFLVNGAWDQWWHKIYGFDVTILSPPHIGLLSCTLISMAGAVAAFASPAYGGASTRGRFSVRAAGVAFVAALTAAYSAVVFGVVAALVPTGGLDIDPVQIYMATMFVAVFMAAAAAARVPFTATAVGAIVVVLKMFYEWFVIAGNDWYAGSLGLYLRDDVLASGERVSNFAAGMPAVALPAGLLIDLILLLGIRRGWPGRRVVAAAGAVSGLLLVAFFYAGMQFFHGAAEGPAAVSGLTILVAVPLAAAVALGGWQLGNLIRALR